MPRIRSAQRTAVAATEFKQRCLALVDEVERTGHEIIVTRHGRPVARLVPIGDAVPSALGWMAGTLTAHRDLTAPEPAWNLDEPIFPP